MLGQRVFNGRYYFRILGIRRQYSVSSDRSFLDILEFDLLLFRLYVWN